MMTTNNDDLAAQLAALEATVADLKAQCDAVHLKLGWPSWANERGSAPIISRRKAPNFHLIRATLFIARNRMR